MTVAFVHGTTDARDTIPIGTIVAWSQSTPPTNWRLCDGSQILIASDPELYETLTAAGTIFPFGANTNGSGSAGSTHFRLPDIRNRVVRTPSTTSPPSGFNSNVGVTGGSNNNTHNHVFTASATANSATGGGHSHTPANTGTDSPDSGGHGFGANHQQYNGGGVNNGSGTAAGTAFRVHGHNSPNSNQTSSGHGGHGHNVGGSSTTSDGAHSHSITKSGTNSPTAVDHRPPYLEVNYIIFRGSA